MAKQQSTDRIEDVLRQVAHPLGEEERDLDPLLELVGDSRLVLLGESTHGTSEFYHQRARLTRRLIEERGFTTVAVEADWPDAYRANRYVRGGSDDGDAAEALGDFQRFPLWMWRNTEVVAFLEWLRERNAARPREVPAVGFYGLDLYSLRSSMDRVLAFLDEAGPEAAARARVLYGCFDQFGEDAQAYGHAAALGVTEPCERQVIQQLVELQRHADELAQRDGRIPEDEYFFAEQNARLVRNAEEYYRSMFFGRVSTWNLRDGHMAGTLDALLRHFDAKGLHTKVVVWAHNSHIGDARATEMGRWGEWNLGQLARERHPSDAVLIGFTTSTGTVTAASDWGGPAERKRVRSPLSGSYEELLQGVGLDRFHLRLRDGGPARELLEPQRLERAIGVIYRPESERVSHYFHASLPRQLDALIHIDRTRALEPLEPGARWRREEPPSTYPFSV